MKKKILLSLLIVVALFTITGCGNKEEKSNNNGPTSNNKTYKCEYSVKNDGMQTIDEYIIELDSNRKAVTYSQITGYENASDSFYKSFCDGIKAKEENHDYLKMTATCDDSSKKAISTKVYSVSKIRDMSEFSKINEFLNNFTKEDGTFDLDAFKNYFNTDSLKAGKYTCNF